jgi:hypothetical protein
MDTQSKTISGRPGWLKTAASHPSPVTDWGGLAVAILAALAFVAAKRGMIPESVANDIAGWVAVGGLLFIGLVRVVRAPFWMIQHKDWEIARYERMVRVLALLHAPGIEDIVPISRHGKMLTFHEVNTEEEFLTWGQMVDDWWQRFEGLKPQFSLVERNYIAYMDSADHDGSAPRVNFSPKYLERWRNVKSTWQTLDLIIKEREEQRRTVRSEMIREGFDSSLLPPHFTGSEVAGSTS